MTFSISLILAPQLAQARGLCPSLFNPTAANGDMDATIDKSLRLAQSVLDLKLFKSTQRGRKREHRHIVDDLTSLNARIKTMKAEGQEYQKDLLNTWDQYLSYWLQQIQNYESLPDTERRRMKTSLEVAISLGTKHLISFLEAPHHRRWKLERLLQVLNSGYAQSTGELTLSLFLVEREVQKYYSHWDFINCRY
jgi:septal ring factor EnvC (AmiA/AmiB activator)